MTTFMGFDISRDGYGHGYQKIAAALQRIDPTVQIANMAVADDVHEFTPAGREWTLDDTAVALCTPEWLPSIHAPRKIIMTMHESTQPPQERIELINAHADALIVPCTWNAEVFRGQGVTVPIYVAKWGVDAQEYYPMKRERTASQPYTFLWSGTPDQRKGWDVAYRAFWQAFQGDLNVRLVLHFRSLPMGLREVGDKNVEMIVGRLPHHVQRELLRYADCYVFPSRGEGWGMPPREAAATGLPVIATNFGGLAEEIDEWALPLGITGMSAARYGFWEDASVGEWAEPDVDELAAHLRLIAQRPQVWKQFGAQAADWIARECTWERTAKKILEVVCRLNTSATPAHGTSANTIGPLPIITPST